jgi:uncharacterized protein YjbI with pentapeptide repeats
VNVSDVNVSDVNVSDVNVSDVNVSDVNVSDVNVSDVNIPSRVRSGSRATGRWVGRASSVLGSGAPAAAP